MPITTQKIDLLIDEAKQAKQDANLFLPIKKPVKVLSVLIVPITIYIIQQQFTSSNVGASNVILLLVIQITRQRHMIPNSMRVILKSEQRIMCGKRH